ncbi:hypothetical protein JIQ42_08169 [Leishmania sp. Namibia]|uniref:hypothetical protein n=1 Tax=Leishmania sp. Namibia TaxID=2802991 RepID=UPI001B6E7937|nr:hypothetical protein JIQ42_08169 [Leishmania sp. Namibia]
MTSDFTGYAGSGARLVSTGAIVAAPPSFVAANSGEAGTPSASASVSRRVLLPSSSTRLSEEISAGSGAVRQCGGSSRHVGGA